MSTTTVNIAFQQTLLREIDAVADREARSRSELIREAARVYIDDRKNWHELLSYGRAKGQELQITDAEIMAEIKAFIPESLPEADEIHAIAIAQRQIADGNVLAHNEINWND